MKMISPAALRRAKDLCSARESLPNDWETWFPPLMPRAVNRWARADSIQRRAETLTNRGEFIRAAQCLAMLHYSGSPQWNENLSPDVLVAARAQCGIKPLPDDWDNWFPQAISLEVEIDGPIVTAQDVIDYALKRLGQVTDRFRFIEGAQCLALIHYLEIPSRQVGVTSIHG